MWFLMLVITVLKKMFFLASKKIAWHRLADHASPQPASCRWLLITSDARHVLNNLDVV